jgi:hypothetical protein
MVAGVSDEDGAASGLAGAAGPALDSGKERARGSEPGRWSALPSAGIALDHSEVFPQSLDRSEVSSRSFDRSEVLWGSLGHAGGLRGAPTPGFLVELDLAPQADGSALFCPEVRGFEEALRAAEDGTLASTRLALASVDADAAAWLEAWSEDEETVERTVRVARLADGASLTVVATLAIFGRGVDTSLAVSARAPRAARPPLDSGVYVTVR